MITGADAPANNRATSSMAEASEWIFGGAGILPILAGGVQAGSITSMGMSRKVGPLGSRWAISPALVIDS